MPDAKIQSDARNALSRARRRLESLRHSAAPELNPERARQSPLDWSTLLRSLDVRLLQGISGRLTTSRSASAATGVLGELVNMKVLSRLNEAWISSSEHVGRLLACLSCWDLGCDNIVENPKLVLFIARWEKLYVNDRNCILTSLVPSAGVHWNVKALQTISPLSHVPRLPESVTVHT